MRNRTLLGALALVIAGCSDVTPPTTGGPNRSISDGVHAAGNPNFFFLPPMVSNPVTSGTFDASLSPVVQICRLDGEACATDGILARFTTSLATTTTTQSGNSETVRLGADHYIVNWHTDVFVLDPASTYRVCVFVSDGGSALGHADVDVVGSGKELKNVDTQEFVALLDGRTLPIKVRIEGGAGDHATDTACGGGVDF